MAAPSPNSMFDREVVDELRRQFNAADKDGNGELDASEACEHFARACHPEATEEEIRRTADGLRNQVDSDRSGTISFNEYCFRFGRRYQMEHNRRRRAGANSTTSATTAPVDTTTAQEESSASAELRREREALEREREALRREREELNRTRSSPQDSGTPSQPPPQTGQGTTQNLAAGARVTVQGLRGSPELNGRTGRIIRFDEAGGRYVVQMEHDGCQKSLRPENLSALQTPSASPSTSAWESFSKKATDTFRKTAAHVQVWLAGYEWWQIMLGAGLAILMICAWFQVSGRYTGKRSSYQSGNSRRPAGAGGSMPRRDWSRDEFADSQRYREEDYSSSGDYYGGRREQQRPRYDQYDEGYGDYEGGGYSGGGGGYSGSSGGMFGDNGQLYTLVILGGLGYMCYKGIIPVHRMDWFQLYMLWNMISPLLLGGRGGGMYGGGYGRRRRGFF